jgi:hypothetical protein
MVLVANVSLVLFSFHQKHPGSLLEGFSGVQVSTLAVNEGLLVAGGFQGELICMVRHQLRLGCIFASVVFVDEFPFPLTRMYFLDCLFSLHLFLYTLACHYALRGILLTCLFLL